MTWQIVPFRHAVGFMAVARWRATKHVPEFVTGTSDTARSGLSVRRNLLRA